MVYGAFWIALAVAVNALGRGSATNAVALAGVFFAVIAVLPGIASAVVSIAHPPATRIELISALRDASLDLRRDGSRLLARYYEDHPELRPPGAPEADFGKLFVSVQLELDRIGGPIEARFRGRLTEQQALVDRIRFLSPAILAQEAMTDLAGTGAARHARFDAQVEDLRASYRDFFVPRILAGRRLAPEDYAAIPRFGFREEPAAALARRVLGGLAGLMVSTVALVIFAAVRLRRDRVAHAR
jgi:ABC-2 type transport system permease protein